MISVLEIGSQGLDLKDDARRELQKRRRIKISNFFKSYNLILYLESVKENKISVEKEADNLTVYFLSGSKIFVFLNLLKISRRIFKRQSIDVISCMDVLLMGLVGVFLKFFYRIPLNVQLHFDYFSDYFWEFQKRPRIIKIFYKFISWFVYKNSDSIRVVSKKTKNDLEQGGFKNKLIETIPTPVELNSVNYENVDSKVCEEFRSGSKTKLLLYVGRLVEGQKELSALLKAFQIVSLACEDVRLLLIGCGLDEEFYKNLARELDINRKVFFLGAKSNEEVFSYYACCDIFVISSKFEGRPTVLTEATLSKKPIVATRFTGTQDLIIDGKTGYVVDIGDYKSFADRVLKLLNDPMKIKEFGEAAFANTSKIIEKINDISVFARFLEKTADAKP
ncbi:MAG: glycosyltransferase family 4 protein [Candidatus Omnitrophota bacterium]